VSFSPSLLHSKKADYTIIQDADANYNNYYLIIIIKNKYKKRISQQWHLISITITIYCYY